jgi:hypothetical protein
MKTTTQTLKRKTAFIFKAVKGTEIQKNENGPSTLTITTVISTASSCCN